MTFMNNNIRRVILKRDRASYRAKDTDNPKHWASYRQKRNDVMKLVRDAKASYKETLTSLLIDKDIPPDKWWRTAKSVCRLSKCGSTSPSLVNRGYIHLRSV